MVVWFNAQYVWVWVYFGIERIKFMEIFLRHAIIVINLPGLDFINFGYKFGVETQLFDNTKHFISMIYTFEPSLEIVCTESKYLSYPVVYIIVDERTKYQSHYKLTQFHIVAILSVEHRPNCVRSIQLGRLNEVSDDGAHELAVAVRVECHCGANPDALLNG